MSAGATAGNVTWTPLAASTDDNKTIIWSVDVKAAGYSSGNLQFYDKSGAYQGVLIFDLATETFSAAAGPGGTPTIWTRKLRDGWWRVARTCLTGIGSSNPSFRLVQSLSPGTADGVSGIAIRRAQFEYGARPTSYIETAAGTASRAGDTLTLGDTGINDWNLTYNDGADQFSGVNENLLVPASNRRWLKSFSARPTVPAGGPTALFSDGSGYSQATVFGTIDQSAALGSGKIVLNVFGATRPLRWSDWFSIYHPTRGWRAYRYWDASDPVNVVRTVDGVSCSGQQYTLALDRPLREAVLAGDRVEIARPMCVMRFPRGFNLEWRIRGFWRSSPSLKFVEAEVR